LFKELNEFPLIAIFKDEWREVWFWELKRLY
jgi:hypothetical protein